MPLRNGIFILEITEKYANELFLLAAGSSNFVDLSCGIILYMPHYQLCVEAIPSWLELRKNWLLKHVLCTACWAGVTPSSGQATMSVVSCASHIGDLSVKFHGGTAWILNLFKGKIEDKIRHALEPKVRSQGGEG